MSAPTYARRFILIDVALNIAPTTDQKRDICQNAIGFAGAIGMEVPKVTLLAAVELVETKMQATVDGAILAKMADRGQIVGDDMRVLEASHDPRAAAAIDSYTYAIVKYAGAYAAALGGLDLPPPLAARRRSSGRATGTRSRRPLITRASGRSTQSWSASAARDS